MMEAPRENGHVSTITMVERREGSDQIQKKGKGVRWATPLSVSSRKTKEQGSGSDPIATKTTKWKKGLAIADFVLRLGAIGAGMGSAVTMGTNEEILPFFTQFLQFHAQWNEFPMFQFFVVANGVVSGYSILTLPFSYVCIVRPHAVPPRLLLITCDIVMAGIVTAGASSAAATVYLAHNGSREANWMAICQGFSNFCQTASEAVVISYVAVVFFLCLILLSALALKRN